MDFNRYIFSIGSLSDNAALVYRTICSLSGGKCKFTLSGGSIAYSIGWFGEAGRKRVSRAIEEIICSGLIMCSGKQTKIVEIVKPVSEKKDDSAIYKDLIRSANDSLPKHSKLDKELRTKIDTWLSNHLDGEANMFKAIKLAGGNLVVRKYGNMDLSMLIDRADDLLAGKYAEHSKKKREPKRGNGLKLTAESNSGEFNDDI